MGEPTKAFPGRSLGPRTPVPGLDLPMSMACARAAPEPHPPGPQGAAVSSWFPTGSKGLPKSPRALHTGRLPYAVLKTGWFLPVTG